MLLGADDVSGELAERYGYVNRALPDAELDSFVDALAMRIASFDKQAIAETKRLVERGKPAVGRGDRPGMGCVPRLRSASRQPEPGSRRWWRAASIAPAMSRTGSDTTSANWAAESLATTNVALQHRAGHASARSEGEIHGLHHQYQRNPASVDVDGDTPLLWVLRDVLGMTGTKFGCGMALCGACTVHIDGVATRSCITSIDSIGKSAGHDDRSHRRDGVWREDPESVARP